MENNRNKNRLRYPRNINETTTLYYTKTSIFKETKTNTCHIQLSGGKVINRIEEFREEYISLLNKEEDFKSLLDLLQIKKEDLGLYEEKLKKILINKTLKEELQIPESTLNKKILNEIFNFKNIEDDENIKNLENELQLTEKEIIHVNKHVLINNFYNLFNNKKD